MEAAMANLDLNDMHTDMDTIRRMARRSAHAQRARIMLAAAGLASLGILSIAGAMLTHAF
jgi:hypothetical protein